jgi:mycothiol synthase
MDIRPLTLDDAAEVTALIRRFETFWEAPLATPVEQVREELTAPHLDIETETRGYWLEDEMVAYGLIWHRPSGARLERAYTQGLVDPAFRGQGIGRHLLAWEIERATKKLEETDPSLPRFIRADEWEWIKDAHRLYERFGMTPVRYFKEMIRALDGRVEVDTPDGISIIPFDRAHDESTLVAWNESFTDHWGSTPLDAATYKHRIEGEGTLESLSFLALGNDEVVGLALNGNYPDDEDVIGRREGWVEVLGVKREWRARGVARALLKTSFNAFEDAGLTHAAIGVDAENSTGAFGLYESLGFEVAQGTITFEIELPRPTE